ncbi:Exo-beta-D-glucosaminidase [Magnetospirillum sp. XM-1]|nr:Exo-beta-D-glucosaminidase [Magnetospirillum sp. XM-1]
MRLCWILKTTQHHSRPPKPEDASASTNDLVGPKPDVRLSGVEQVKRTVPSNGDPAAYDPKRTLHKGQSEDFFAPIYAVPWADANSQQRTLY